MPKPTFFAKTSLLILVAIFFLVPFASSLGPRIYDRFAASRTRVCTVETCGRAARMSGTPTSAIASSDPVQG